MSIYNFNKGKKIYFKYFKLKNMIFYLVQLDLFWKIWFFTDKWRNYRNYLFFCTKNKVNYSFILFLICRKEFVKYTINMSIGTKMPIIGWEDFKNIFLQYPIIKPY